MNDLRDNFVADRENGIDSALTGNSDQNERPSSSRKRKEEKARVVWTVDSHRKFIAAVNQLGIDKAVPEKILDLMNVEKLTREDVARHLQKYRLYLKTISNENQQANMAALLGSSADTSR